MKLTEAFKDWKNRALNNCTDNGGHLPTLQEAFEAGYKAGHKLGYDAGYPAGWTGGYNTGRLDGVRNR